MSLNNQTYYNYIDKKTIPIVFIHGVGLDHKMWVPQINYFKNYSTITYDLLGHGKTPFKKEKIKMHKAIWLDTINQEKIIQYKNAVKQIRSK